MNSLAPLIACAMILQYLLFFFFSGNGLSQYLSGGDKMCFELRVSSISISHGDIEPWIDGNRHQNNHLNLSLLFPMLGGLLFTGGGDLKSQHNFVCMRMCTIRQFTPWGKIQALEWF